MSQKDYLNVSIEILGEATVQRAQILRSITVNELIAEIVTEFEFEDSEQFTLFRKQYGEQLNPEQTLVQQNIEADATLHFDRVTTQERSHVDHASTVQLVLLGGIHRVFPVLWQPAIIGRYDPAHGERLAVDLEPHLGRRISRKHALITEEAGTYYIESLSPQNPTRLNSSLLQAEEKYPLKNGDILDIKRGEVRLQFEQSNEGEKS